MATPIIVNPTKPSQVVVNGTQKSGTPITINTDLDYTRVQSMIGEALGDVKIDTTELAKEDTLLTESQRIQDEVRNIDFSSVNNKVDEVKQAVENIDLTPIENKVDDGVNTLSAKIDNIDLSAVESKVQEESAAIQSKIDNIQFPEIDTTSLAKQATLIKESETIQNAIRSIKFPEIDTTELAQQGDDPNATLTAIYKLLKGSEPDTPEVIPEGVAERLALILEFFGIKPLDTYEFITPEEICSTLEEIMTSMDLGLTQEMAATITNNTLNEQ